MTDLLRYELNSDQMRMLNPDARLLLYDQIEDMNSIDQVFGGYQKVIVLYLLQSAHEGHWCCLFKRGQQLNYFDSYGKPVDAELKLLDPALREKLHEKHDRLKQLTWARPPVYNEVCLQSPYTQTCGMFVTHRLHHSYLNSKDYVELFRRYNEPPDVVVAKYVGQLLKNIDH